MSELIDLYDRKRLENCARACSRPVEQIAAGLQVALYESGPNHLSELADAMAVEGNPLMEPNVRAAWAALGVFRGNLTDYLDNRNAAFIGGTAIRAYGAKTIPPIDYDVLIEPRMLEKLTTFLEREGGQVSKKTESIVTFKLPRANTRCTAVLANTPLYREALERARPALFFEVALKLVLPGALGALKVDAYQDRKGLPAGENDWTDLHGLIECGATSQAAIEDILQRTCPQLVPVLTEMLAQSYRATRA